MRKLYNVSRISFLFSYTVEDVCNLYSLHPQTVHKWIKKGLKTVDSCKPILMHGVDLKDFLKKVNEEHKHRLKFNEFYCVACKEAHIPLRKRIYLEQNSSFIKAKGLCPITRKIMNRSYKIADYSELKKIFTLEEMVRLYDSSHSTFKAHINPNEEQVPNEPPTRALTQEKLHFDRTI